MTLERELPRAEPVLTDANGVFRFTLQDTRWRVQFLQVEKEGFGTRQITDVPVGRGFTITLDDVTRLKGQFSLPDGKPAGKATLSLMCRKKTIREWMGYLVHDLRLDRQTEDDSAFDFPLEPGVYDVQVTSEHGYLARLKDFRVEAGKTTILSTQLQTGVSFRLQTVDSVTGQPVAGVNLYIEERGSINPKEGSGRVTDEQGFAKWNGLMPGWTRFEVIKQEYKRFWSSKDLNHELGYWDGNLFKGPPQWGRAIDSLDFNLRPDMPAVVVQLERGVHVHGKVLAPDGTPAAKIDLNTNENISSDARYQFKTDDQGRFSSYLPAGNGVQYYLTSHDPQKRWANGVSQKFDSKPGDELEFTMRFTGGGWIAGRVVDQNGNPVAGTEVYATAEDRLDNSYFDPESVTDAEGHFKLGPMRVGEYTIGQRQPQTIMRAGMNEPLGKRIVVAEGQTTDAGDILRSVVSDK